MASNAAGNPMNLSDSHDVSMTMGNKAPELQSSEGGFSMRPNPKKQDKVEVSI